MIGVWLLIFMVVGLLMAIIGRKLEQQQQLQAKEYELKKSEMDAKIRIQNANGIAEAQYIIDKTLTPEYLQFEAIQMMKEVAHSPNSTFVFVPTSGNQLGMPMVYSLKDFQKSKKGVKIFHQGVLRNPFFI